MRWHRSSARVSGRQRHQTMPSGRPFALIVVVMMRASSRWSRAHAPHQAGRSTRRAPAAHRFLSPRSLALPARLLALPVPVPACTGAYGIVWKAVDKKTKEVIAENTTVRKEGLIQYFALDRRLLEFRKRKYAHT